MLGDTALQCAAGLRNGDAAAIISLLLANGGQVNVVNNIGETPLIDAAKNPDAANLLLLLNHGAIVNAADHHGDTALMAAATRDRLPAVKALVEAGAAVNCRNRHGITPLRRALRRGNDDVAAYLRLHGARE